MDFRKVNRANLVDFAKNTELRLADHELTSIPNDIADDLAAELAPLNTSLETVTEDIVENIALKESVVAVGQAQETALIEILGRVLNMLRAFGAPRADYELAGFSAPADRVTYIPATPTELAAMGSSNNTNKLTFQGNNQSGSVTYVIEAIIGDTAPYVVVGTTRRQNWTHENVTTGQFFQDRVFAQAAKSRSEYSNLAVVYGVAP